MACLVDSHADQTKQGLPMEKEDRGRKMQGEASAGGDDDDSTAAQDEAVWMGSVVLSTGCRRAWQGNVSAEVSSSASL